MAQYPGRSKPAYTPTESYEEWVTQTWEAAFPALQELVEYMKKNGLKHAVLEKPFGLEVVL